MILLDTSVVIDIFTREKRCAPALHAAFERGERVAIPALVLYEWLRGPRSLQELLDQERLFPREQVLPFEPGEAALAAEIYKKVPAARRREFDLAIAASAIGRGAELWTLNPADFRDIPGLRVSRPG